MQNSLVHGRARHVTCESSPRPQILIFVLLEFERCHGQGFHGKIERLATPFARHSTTKWLRNPGCTWCANWRNQMGVAGELSPVPSWWLRLSGGIRASRAVDMNRPLSRLLLVEDDLGLGETLTERLGREGYQIRWAQTIDEAKKAMKLAKDLISLCSI